MNSFTSFHARTGVVSCIPVPSTAGLRCGRNGIQDGIPRGGGWEKNYLFDSQSVHVALSSVVTSLCRNLTAAVIREVGAIPH